MKSFGASVCRFLSYHSRNNNPPEPVGEGAILAPRRTLPRQCRSTLSPTQGLGERALVASPVLRSQSLTFCLAPDILLAAPAQEQTQSKIWKQEELLQLAGTGDGQAPLQHPCGLPQWGVDAPSPTTSRTRWAVEVGGKFLLTLT